MRLRAGLLVVGGVAVVACGLDVVGISLPGDAVTATTDGDDAGAPEPERIGDGSERDDTDAAPPEETTIDAGPVEAGACGASVLVDNFAMGLGNWTHYGGVEQRIAQNNNAYARLIAEGASSRAAGMFWLPTVKAKAFKATFAYFVSTPFRYWYMGDGFTFTWLTSTGGAALGTGALNGQALGMQPGVAGYAFALDGWKNTSTGDRDAPSLAFLAIDPSRGNPGSYDWHVAKNGPYYREDLYDAWRTIEISVMGGKASARFRFSPTGPLHRLFDDVPVDSSTSGTSDIVAMGFTASTGGSDAMGFAIDTVSFELIDATCP